MDLGEKNGQPSMEEILASIRRIIAEEPTPANPVIDLHAKYKAKGSDADDSNDFELPAIFRPNGTSTPERQPLFGRLTDAIRNASGSNGDAKAGKINGTHGDERYRGAIRDSGSVLAVANPDFAAAQANAEARGSLRDAAAGSPGLTSALSSLRLTRGEAASGDVRGEASPVVAPLPQADPAPVAAAPLQAQALPPSDEVKRVMVPFRDQRMSRMGSGEATAAPTTTPVNMETLFTPDVAATPVVQTPFEAPPVPSAPSSFGFEESFSLDDMHRVAPVVDRPPPPPPAAPTVQATDGGIEDTTADLLRPMLRQWLAENMPRMVEKALSIELAESVKVNRRFTGS